MDEKKVMENAVVAIEVKIRIIREDGASEIVVSIIKHSLMKLAEGGTAKLMILAQNSHRVREGEWLIIPL